MATLLLPRLNTGQGVSKTLSGPSLIPFALQPCTSKTQTALNGCYGMMGLQTVLAVELPSPLNPVKARMNILSSIACKFSAKLIRLICSRPKGFLIL